MSKASPELKAAVCRIIGEAGKMGISSADIYNRCTEAEKPADVAHALKALQEEGKIHHKMSSEGEGRKKYLVKLYMAKTCETPDWNQAAQAAAEATEQVTKDAVDQVLDQHAAIEDKVQAIGIHPAMFPVGRNEGIDLGQQLEDANTRIAHQDELLKRYEERAADQEKLIESRTQEVHELAARYARVLNDLIAERNGHEQTRKLVTRLELEIGELKSQLDAGHDGKRHKQPPADFLYNVTPEGLDDQPVLSFALPLHTSYIIGRAIEAIAHGDLKHAIAQLQLVADHKA